MLNNPCFKKCIFLFVFFGCLLMSGKAFAFSEPNAWSWQNPLPQGNDLKAVCFGNDSFVAVGEHGTILYSADGQTWNIENSGTLKSLLAVTYGNNIYIATGENGTILRSPNGKDWTSTTPATSLQIMGVTYGNGIFIAVGEGGTILKSADGDNWVCVSSGSSSILRDVAYGNGLYVVVGDRGTVLISQDEQNWVNKSIPASNNLKHILFENGIFTAVGNNFGAPSALCSVDGINWNYVIDNSEHSQGSIDVLNGIAYGNNSYIAVSEYHQYGSYNGNIYSWTDGQNQGMNYQYNSNRLCGIVFGNGVFIAVGYEGIIISSQDGQNWNRVSEGSTNGLRAITYGNSRFIAVGGPNGGGPSGTILSSLDGHLWNAISTASVFYPPLFGVVYGNGTFVANTSYNGVIISSDGETWISKIFDCNSLNAITYGNNLFVAVGNNSTIYTSIDGITWNQQSIEQGIHLSDIVYGNGKYVAVGIIGGGEWNATILVSQDGLSWTRKTYYNYDLGKVAYGNGVFIAIGDNGTLMSSSDGENWSITTSKALWGISDITFSDGVFVAVGDGNVIVSTNGIVWDEMDSGTSQGLSAVEYCNGVFIAVGEGGTIISSSNEIIKQIVAKPTDARAKEIIIGGTTLSSFDSVTEGYNIELPYGTTTIPAVTSTTNNPNATVVITAATALPGSTKVKVTAADGVTTKIYTINFTVATEQIDECFIATAAFGSKFEPAVVLLRHFRDQFLLTNKLGTAFVRFYYHNSPLIAAYIAQSEPLKAMVRALLMPVIAIVYSFMHPTVGVGCIIVLALILATKKRRINKIRA